MRRACAWLGLAATILLAACVSQETKRDAINDINQAFKEEYEATLARNGTRLVEASPGLAFDATVAALASLGMNLRQQSRGLGFVNADIAAPLPLSRDEWDRAAAADLPRARELLRKHVGMLAEFFTFEPKGVDLVITATIIETRGGSEISLTMRMREIAPTTSGLPRREYPPPSALRLGLDKIWIALERELGAKTRHAAQVGDLPLVTSAIAGPVRSRGSRTAPAFQATAWFSSAPTARPAIVRTSPWRRPAGRLAERAA
jgi:hypothetical protein